MNNNYFIGQDTNNSNNTSVNNVCKKEEINMNIYFIEFNANGSSLHSPMDLAECIPGRETGCRKALYISMGDCRESIKARIGEMLDVPMFESLDTCPAVCGWVSLHECLDTYFQVHDGIRAAIVYKPKNFNPPKIGNRNEYPDDYAGIVALEGLVKKHGVKITLAIQS